VFTCTKLVNNSPPTTYTTHSTDEYEDDGMGPREFADTTSISISRTAREKEQALSLHKMAGLRKGRIVYVNVCVLWCVYMCVFCGVCVGACARCDAEYIVLCSRVLIVF